MENLIKMRGDYADIQSKIDGLENVIRTEKRGMTEQERTDFNNWASKQDELRAAIEAEEKLVERATKKAIAANPKRSDEEKALDNYSIHKVIQARANGRNLNGPEAEWEQEVRHRQGDGTSTGFGVPVEYFRHVARKHAQRDYTATGGTGGNQGGDFIATDKGAMIEALSPYLVLDKMGVRTFSNLRGNLSIPKETTAATAIPKAETAAAADVSSATDTVELSAKRIPAYINYSHQMMAQSSVAMDSYIQSRVLKSIANGLQKQAIQGSGTSNELTGLITQLLATGTATTGGSIVETNGTLDWDSVVDLEAAVDTSDALMGQLAYLTSAKMRGALKTTKKDAGSGLFLWNSMETETPVNGYKCWITNHVPDTVNTTPVNGTYTPLIFGNWDHFAIAQWGDIFIDVVNSNAASGYLQVVVNSFWDCAALQTKSFAMFSDISLTTSFGSLVP